MMSHPRSARPVTDLRLALSLDDSLADVLRMLGVRAAPAFRDLRPGLLPRSAATDDHAAEMDDGLPDGSKVLRGFQLLVADPWDVPLLVEFGAADAGVAPKHVLAELRADLFEVLDLRVADQRLAHVAAAGGARLAVGRRPLLATAHPSLTRAHFARAGVQVETLALRSAADLAAALGAADGAVVLLPPEERQTAGHAAGSSAQPAALSVQAEVLRSSARLVVNRSARVVRAAEVGALVDRLRRAVRSRAVPRPGAARAPSDPPIAEEA